MPKRDERSYPRLTVRQYGPWGAWKAAVVVKVKDTPTARERCLTIQPDYPRALSAARAIIERCSVRWWEDAQ